MAVATVQQAKINYEIIGTDGPWVALVPGGRRDLNAVRPLAEEIAGHGYRVVIHDRRNCGASDVVLGGAESEFQIWADDLHALLEQLGALPVIIGGSSAGCRTSIAFALRYPSDVRALLLWRVTGGPFAANRLAYNYYTQFIEAAERGGMQAVCECEHFAERIAANPANRERILSIPVTDFVRSMKAWRQYFLDDADKPVIGASAEQLESIHVPTCIVPGNDRTHSHATGEEAHKRIADSELHNIFPVDEDVDVASAEEWEAKDKELAGTFTSFLERKVLLGTFPSVG